MNSVQQYYIGAALAVKKRLQYNAMRTILKCNRYTPTQFMLAMLQWLNVRQSLQLNMYLYIHIQDENRKCTEINEI